jgi:hypothetical protein
VAASGTLLVRSTLPVADNLSHELVTDRHDGFRLRGGDGSERHDPPITSLGRAVSTARTIALASRDVAY